MARMQGWKQLAVMMLSISLPNLIVGKSHHKDYFFVYFSARCFYQNLESSRKRNFWRKYS
jgi:hypothetical protein